MKRIVLLFLTVILASPIAAQKVLKPVREQIKAGKGAEALKLVEKLEKDSIAQRLPKLYDYGKQAQMLVNSSENEKIYLKQAYDTAKFFSSTIGIYDYIMKCEREEQRELAEEGHAMKYHNDNSTALHNLYANLSAGGRYYYSKRNYTEAMKYLSAYLDLPQQPIWGADKAVTTSPVYTANAYLYQRSAYLSKDYSLVPRYESITLADTSTRRSSTLEVLAVAANARQDTTAYISYLRQGFADYPDNLFFFTHLADHYAAQQDHKTILLMADSLLLRDSLNVIALEAKSLALLNLQHYDEAITTADRCIAADTTHVDAYLYAGTAYYNKALAVTTTANVGTKAYRTAKARQKGFYEKARTYLETYRAARQDDKAHWASMLYKIYFSLNMGKQFEEISKIAESVSTSK